MRKIRIEPYKTWSGGARRLGQRAGILRATKRQVQRHGDFDLIINWGRSERRFNGEYLNEPAKVGAASNKLTAAKAFDSAEVSQPAFTESRDTAQEWIDDGQTVLGRTLLRASGGRGIVLCSKENGVELPKARLYTRYVPKKDEYRIHVWKGEVIDVQQKRRKKDVPDDEVNWQIRNTDNGFIFARSDVSPPSCIGTTACAAVVALDLDFACRS